MKDSGEPELVLGAQTTTNFFSTLGVTPMLGRDFRPGEDIAAGPTVAILSYGYWMRKFGGDRNLIGRSIRSGDRAFLSSECCRREFEFAPRGNAEYWVPMHIGGRLASGRSMRWMPVVARLAPGVDAARARPRDAGGDREPGSPGVPRERFVECADRVLPRPHRRFSAVPASGSIRRGRFVLLICCANIANLLMVRAAGRRKEFAIRAALGAGSSRLIYQLLTESLMLALAGGALGLLLARWGTSLMIAAIPQTLLNPMPFLRRHSRRPGDSGISVRRRCHHRNGVRFGPALQVSRWRAGDVLKEEARSSGSRLKRRLRNGLVIAEVAVSLRAPCRCGSDGGEPFSALLHRDPGFDKRNLLTFAVNLPQTSYPMTRRQSVSIASSRIACRPFPESPPLPPPRPFP